jgi:hypothetical protein
MDRAHTHPEKGLIVFRTLREVLLNPPCSFRKPTSPKRHSHATHLTCCLTGACVSPKYPAVPPCRQPFDSHTIFSTHYARARKPAPPTCTPHNLLSRGDVAGPATNGRVIPLRRVPGATAGHGVAESIHTTTPTYYRSATNHRHHQQQQQHTVPIPPPVAAPVGNNSLIGSGANKSTSNRNSSSKTLLGLAYVPTASLRYPPPADAYLCQRRQEGRD